MIFLSTAASATRSIKNGKMKKDWLRTEIPSGLPCLFPITSVALIQNGKVSRIIALVAAKEKFFGGENSFKRNSGAFFSSAVQRCMSSWPAPIWTGSPSKKRSFHSWAKAVSCSIYPGSVCRPWSIFISSSSSLPSFFLMLSMSFYRSPQCASISRLRHTGPHFMHLHLKHGRFGGSGGEWGRSILFGPSLVLTMSPLKGSFGTKHFAASSPRMLTSSYP